MGPSAKQSQQDDNDPQQQEANANQILSESTSTELPIRFFVPDYLKQFVFPCYGDFCQSPCFHQRLIAQLMAEGFLPIAMEKILLPKLHRQRCVISLPHQLRVRKSVRKKSKRFSLSVNREFDAVIQGCHNQHGSSCWLVPPLVEAFRELHQAGTTEATLVPEQTKCKIRMYSIEVWNQEDTLVGGELGYSVGSIYTSLTGFCSADSAGSVQLVALGKLLCQSGFTLWDLGMDMEYKRELGSHLMPRAEFVEYVKRVRATDDHVVLPTAQDPPVNCKAIVDGTQQQQTQVSATNMHSSRPSRASHPVHASPVEDDGGPNKKPRERSPESVEKVPEGRRPTS